MNEPPRLQLAPFMARITSDPDLHGGSPIVRDTSISVEMVLAHLGAHLDVNNLLVAYPELTTDDVTACLQFAEAAVRAEHFVFGWIE